VSEELKDGFFAGAEAVAVLLLAMLCARSFGGENDTLRFIAGWYMVEWIVFRRRFNRHMASK
jgi:hypothetical protein